MHLHITVRSESYAHDDRELYGGHVYVHDICLASIYCRPMHAVTAWLWQKIIKMSQIYIYIYMLQNQYYGVYTISCNLPDTLEYCRNGPLHFFTLRSKPCIMSFFWTTSIERLGDLISLNFSDIGKNIGIHFFQIYN